MTSNLQNRFTDVVLWICVFIMALAAFYYLDSRIGVFLENRAAEAHQTSTTKRAIQPTPSNINPSDMENSDADRVVLHAGRRGHFKVNAYINDARIKLLADTGATYVVLTYADAEELGLADELEFTGTATTANGVSKVAPVMLDNVQVGDIQVENVQAIVTEEGKLSVSLLGMSFIGRLESFQMSGRELILKQ